MTEKGSRRLVWLSDELFELTEKVRKEMGLSRSGFYRYCILQTLRDLNVLSTKINKSL